MQELASKMLYLDLYIQKPNLGCGKFEGTVQVFRRKATFTQFSDMTYEPTS